MKILILGGYGTFGGRLARLLADEPGLELLIAGRSLRRAREFCVGLSGRAVKRALVFDRDGDLAAQLAAAWPHLLVDASGPFQGYGADPYRVVRACLVQGVDYMDLADGADFVEGIARFDTEARQRGLRVLSGVSSFPVLTAAAVEALSSDLAGVRAVTAGIAPTPYAGVGLNVIRAIAGYAGKPVRLVRGGRPACGNALTETLRYTIAPPGHRPLRSLRFSLVEVPDLRLLPARWPELESVWIGAGPVPELLHRMLNGLAWLVRWGLLPSLLPLAGLFHWVIGHVGWGEHRGGMFVRVEGVDRQGRLRQRAWDLVAEGDDGPLIPSMAVAALVRRYLAGARPAPGARPATGELSLADYEDLFRARAIYAGRRELEGSAMIQSEPQYPAHVTPMWKEIGTTNVAFAVAFLIPSIALALLTPPTGGAINTDLVSISGLTAIFYVYCVGLAGPLAVPTFLLLRRHRLVRWWSALGAGTIIGAIVELVLGLPRVVPDSRVLMAGICMGAFAAMIFWLIWRLGQAR